MDAETSYLFRHALVRAAAYELQTPSQRADLHANTVDIIETMHGELPLSVDQGPMKRHSLDPYSMDQAVHAVAALEGGRNDMQARAEAFLARADALKLARRISEPALEGGWLCGLGTYFVRAGDPTNARETWREGEALLQRSSPNTLASMTTELRNACATTGQEVEGYLQEPGD